MAQEVVITKRFRRNVKKTYDCISENFSSRTAFAFLDKIEQQIEFISRHAEAGRLSQKKERRKEYSTNSA